MSKMKDKAIEKDDREKETMRIWDQVCRTDIDHTKQVTFGRKFTAIDAHSQIMEATRLFGPIGEGWGYENEYGETHLTDGRSIAWCDVTLWWTNVGEWEGHKSQGSPRKYGPVRGAAMLTSFEKGKTTLKIPDTDAYKKASTDGLTKLLSHLGFNADVFLGMFDDNKYVAGLQKEKDEAAGTSADLYAQERKSFIDKIEQCETPTKMDHVLADYKMWIDRLPPGTAVELRGWVEKMKVAEKKDAK